MESIKFSTPEEYIYIYMGIVDGNVDYKKLPNYIPNLLNIGNKISAEKKYTYNILLYDKNSNGYYSKITTVAREENFYIIASFSKKQSFPIVEKISESIKISKPVGFVTVVKIVGFVSLTIHLFVLGVSGLLFLFFYFINEFRTKLFKSIGLYVALLAFCVIIYGYYFIGKELSPYFSPLNADWVIFMVLELTPSIFNTAGEFF